MLVFRGKEKCLAVKTNMIGFYFYVRSKLMSEEKKYVEKQPPHNIVKMELLMLLSAFGRKAACS